MSIASVALAIAIIPIASAGCADTPPRALVPSERAALEQALARALADSAELARTSLDLPVALEMTFAEDESQVRVVEAFRLTKSPGGAFAAIGRTQKIDGDRALLSSMYSFENSKGGLRRDSMATLEGIGFGADQRTILRDILAGRLELVAIRDTVAAIDSTRVITFDGEDVRGSLALDRRTLSARRVDVRRESSSIIGGYQYEMTLTLAAEPTVRLPVAMRTAFRYDRIMSSGSGVVATTIDTTAIPSVTPADAAR